MTEPKRQITELLLAWRSGDGKAIEKLMPLVYDQLRSLASRYLSKERPELTLLTTDLVHEAYLKLLSSEVVGVDRFHFMALVATHMRRILVDHARTKARIKRDDGAMSVTWDDVLMMPQEDIGSLGMEDLLDLDSALNRLAEQDVRLAKVIDCKYFGGWTTEQIAPVLEVSTIEILSTRILDPTRPAHSGTPSFMRSTRHM